MTCSAHPCVCICEGFPLLDVDYVVARVYNISPLLCQELSPIASAPSELRILVPSTMSELSFTAQKYYIDGRPHRSGNKTFTTYNPSTGAAIAQFYAATTEDIDLAIRTPLSAFQSWSQTPRIERSRILLRAVALLRSRNDFIARVETLDTGKAFCETSTADAATGADVLEHNYGRPVNDDGRGEDHSAACVGVGALTGEALGRVRRRRSVELPHPNVCCSLSSVIA